MVQLVIPLKANAAAGTQFADYETVVDSQYDIYSATLLNYPVIDAFDFGGNISQEKRGLQLPSRSPQNDAWKLQVGFGIAVGTTPLIRYSTTYNFNRPIVAMDVANLTINVRTRSANFITLNLGSERIETAPGGDIDTFNFQLYSATLDGWNSGQTGYIGTAGGRKYLFYTVDGAFGTTNSAVYEVDATTLKIIRYVGTTPGATIGVKDDFRWAAIDDAVQLYQFDALGVESTVGATASANPPGATSNQSTTGAIHNNTIYCATKNYGNASIMYYTVDMTNVTAATINVVGSVNPGQSNSFAVALFYLPVLTGGYGPGLVMTYGYGSLIVLDDGGGFTVVTGGYNNTHSGNYNGGIAIRSQMSHVQNYDTENARTNLSGFAIKGTQISEGGFGGHFMMYMYEHTGTEDMTTGFVGCFYDGQAFAYDEDISLDLNAATIVGIVGNIGNRAFKGNAVNLYQAMPIQLILPVETTGLSTRLEFEATYPNPYGRDAKMAFGIEGGATGGTYDVPLGDFENSQIDVTL